MSHTMLTFATFDNLPQVFGSYDWWLVLLSVLMAIFMAMLALQTAHIARYAPNRNLQLTAIATGALALGSGIWITHFIGMLAFKLPAPVDYQAGFTALSLLPALAASLIALRFLAKPSSKRGNLFLTGALIGLGISLMHYIGMAAMQTQLQMRYNPWLLILSVSSAVVLATLSLIVRSKLENDNRRNFYCSSILLGLAIGVMHYLGMAAAEYYGTATEANSGLEIRHLFIALALSSLSVTAGGMVLALNGLMRSHSFNQSMKANQSRLQAILDTAVDAIITIDGYGLIQDFNKGAENLLGYSAFEVIGHNVKMLMPDPYQSEHDGYLSNFRNTGKTKIIGIGREVVAKRKDGTTLPVRLAVGQVNSNLEEEQLFVGLLSDISARRELEESLRETAKQAKQAASAKTSFLANMSHEIRTPMNAILGFTDLLLQTELKPEQQSHLKTIQKSGKNLLGLINDILDTTKIEQGHLILEEKDFSMLELVQQVHSTLQLSAHNKGLYLNLHYQPDMPEFFTGDSLRIAQVITNLVGNAIKFTATGGVELRLSYAQQQVLIEVQDTGIGMNQEQQQSVFEPFTQADASISRRFGGTGLGTTIAKQIIDSMNGTININSAPGQGSTFSVQLPLTLAQKPTSCASSSTVINLPQLRVLIADDVPQNIELLQLILKGEGHEVVSAANGREAVDKFIADSFDLVLMDLHMPEVDGLQACLQIRQHEKLNALKHTPVIALTASVMQHDQEQAMASGMDGFAVKPINVIQLFAEIGRVLQQEQQQPNANLTENNTAQLIDLINGSQLWGSEQRLLQQIQSFAADAEQKYPLAIDMEPEQLAFNLHGLRGASGNLALNSITQLIIQLEQQLAAKTPISQQQLDSLTELFAQVRQLVANKLEPSTTATQSQSIDNEQLLSSMRQLSQLLDKGQLDESLLQELCAALPEQQGKLLQAAVDEFDFTLANQYLEQWINNE